MAKPKRYRALHICPGLVDYTEGNQRETVLVRKEILDKMNPSFLGRPVFNFIHKIIDPETAFNFTEEEKEKQAVGVISGVGYDEKSGYFSADMMIWDDDTQKNIDENGFNVSCAYIPEAGPGGTHNNVPYDEEVTGGEYHHMAIVENPRYEGARIFENSKSGGIMKLIFKGKKVRENQAPPEEKKEPDKEMEVNENAVFKTETGEEIPVSEMVNAYKAMKENIEGAEEEKAIGMEDTVEIDGEQVSMKDLYENWASRQNAEPPTDEPLEPVVEEDMKKNSLGDDDGDRKTKGKNFKLLQNAAERESDPGKPRIETERARIDRGKNRYGTPVHNGGDK